MLGLLIVVEFTRWDDRISELFFDAMLPGFPLKRDFIFDTVLHDWARNIPKIVAACTLFVLATTVFRPNRLLRQSALFVFISMLLSTGLVALIKSYSLIHCPYELLVYGGEFAQVGVLDFLSPAQMPVQEAGKCWPSGHASGGFSLLALYFSAMIYRQEYRIPALVFALAIGFIFTVSQTVRGAHFLSHGLWSLLMVWLVNELLYLVWINPLVRKPVD